MRSVFLMLIILSFWTQAVLAGDYKLDESHTQVGFKIKHLVISTVSGRFNKFTGGFKFDEKKGTLDNVEVTIEAASIDTNEADRDKHLKSKDFFDVEKFPYLKFVSTKVTHKGNKPDGVHGNLTIHGVTKPVVLKVEFNGSATDPWGNERVAFEASTKIKRKDFGLTWNKTLDKGGVMIADDVKVEIEGEAIKQNK